MWPLSTNSHSDMFDSEYNFSRSAINMIPKIAYSFNFPFRRPSRFPLTLVTAPPTKKYILLIQGYFFIRMKTFTRAWRRFKWILIYNFLTFSDYNDWRLLWVIQENFALLSALSLQHRERVSMIIMNEKRTLVHRKKLFKNSKKGLMCVRERMYTVRFLLLL